MIGTGFVGLMSLGAVGSAFKRLDPTTSTIPIPTPGRCLDAGSEPGPTDHRGTLRRAVHLDLPPPGRGWTPALGWPAGESPYSYTVAQIALSASGPWTQATSSRDPASTQVTGVDAATTEWVRVGDLMTIEISGRPVMQGRITAPQRMLNRSART